LEAAQVELPEKLIPVFSGRADVRGAYGGRGSAKTRSFAKMAAVYGYKYGTEGISGQIVCGRQFMNSLEDSSLEECKRAIEEEPFLADYYDVGDRYIKSKDGRIWFTFVGLDRSLASIKSKGRILLLWVDEAEPVTDDAWIVVIPTLREEGEDWNAELWVTWNPKRKTAPVESRFRHISDHLIKVVQLNWRDNQKFPAKLERDRQRDLVNQPEQYDHIWEGGYQTTVVGAYFTKWLNAAKAEGRISRVGPDPLFRYRVFCDLGGSGAKADAFCMWVAQFVGREVRVLNYYEAQGQAFSAHAHWLHQAGYLPTNTDIWLPHDGEQQQGPIDSSWQKEFRKAQYSVSIIPNQGKGAALQRIKAARDLFPSMWFNEATTEAGRAALGFYHEKRDPERDVGLGPEHDWASHSADAFGLMAVAYKPPQIGSLKPIAYSLKGVV
jgi:phage terminase large subunit